MNQDEEVRVPFLLPMLAELELEGDLDKAVSHFVFGLVLIGSILAVLVVALRFVFSCFKRCTSDRVLVIYGLGIKGPGRCIHGRTLLCMAHLPGSPVPRSHTDSYRH